MSPLCFFDTVYCADSVEFCPHPLATEILACGTYQLKNHVISPTSNNHASTPTSPQRRLGRCYIFTVDSEGKLTELQRVDLPAIPDMKWSHTYSETSALLAIADAEGGVTLHQWLINERQLHRVQKIQVRDHINLCLSLDWSDRRRVSRYVSGAEQFEAYVSTYASALLWSDSGARNSIVVSSSDGAVSVLKASETGDMGVALSWKAHDFEPWIAAWDCWSQDVAYSGGDDCKFKGWDTREGCFKPIFVNKSFEAGVTTIQSHPHTEHIITVGSYDATVRLYDTRKPLVPLLQMDIGGGAWRVKWHPDVTRRNDLLVACMHGGYKVLHITPELGGLVNGNDPGCRSYETLTRMDEDCPSLAYGADWSFRPDDTATGTLVATCSFYDHALQTWRC